MKIYDISVPLDCKTPLYPGDAPLEIAPHASIADDGFSVLRLSLSSHTGTHLDAPCHFLEGAPTIDTIRADVTCGPALVAEAAADAVGAAELRMLDLDGCKRLLLKTPKSSKGESRHDPADWPHVTEEGARFLAGKGISLLGIDSLSVEVFEGSGEVHRVLLGAGIVILETIDLSAVPPGWYDLVCLPLKIAGGDGAPARAVLYSRE